MADLGKSLVLFGVALVLLGALLFGLGRLGMPRVPGDVVVRRGGFTLYFPIVTSILLSILLTVVLNLLLRRR